MLDEEIDKLLKDMDKDTEVLNKIMEDQKNCMEKMKNTTFDDWDPEDDYNDELDFKPDKPNEKPDLSHLKYDKDGKIIVDSLRDLDKENNDEERNFEQFM